jgi:methylenetetrahydrofolate dehydrogenase (NADP+)/methenyltetrahydrofolate cyclohydrolase
MAATLMNGTELAARIRSAVAREAEELGGACLATLLVGDDPASHIYIERKHAAANEVGIETRDIRLPASTPEDDVVALVEELNTDDSVDGMLVQLPLPAGMDEVRVTHAVDPVKDVDGFHPVNAGNLYLGTPLHVPATAWGCMELLAEYGIEVSGADAVVVGRSEIVGKPLATLLAAKESHLGPDACNATVTVCHSRTRDLAAICRQADILIAAIGRPKFITGDMIKPGAAVIDVGINRTEAGVVGDVDFEAAKEIAAAITPVPRGVGPMTIAMLLFNTLAAARAQVA